MMSPESQRTESSTSSDRIGYTLSAGRQSLTAQLTSVNKDDQSLRSGALDFRIATTILPLFALSLASFVTIPRVVHISWLGHRRIGVPHEWTRTITRSS